MSENIQVKQLKPVYPAEEHENVRALLDYAAETYGDDAAFILKEKKAGRKAEPVYRNISYKDLREDVRRLGAGLMAEGISHARIAIIGENSYHWQLAYLAAMSGLGICVPLDKGLPYRRADAMFLSSTENMPPLRISFEERRQTLCRHRLRSHPISAWKMESHISVLVTFLRMAGN